MGLPKGATYTVTEADYSGDGYTPTSTGAAGSIVADATQTASFTNTRTVGNLTISKTVAGNAGDTSKKFDFRLTLNGAADIPYAYTGDGVPDGTIKSGDNVSLAHARSFRCAVRIPVRKRLILRIRKRARFAGHSGERTVRIREVESSSLFGSTKPG